MSRLRLEEYRVWDLPTRLFHWLNVLCVFTLIVVGLIMMFRRDLGLGGDEAKIGLKTLHTWVGYVFVINLLWRLLWAFRGSRFARWQAVLPGSGFTATLIDYVRSLREGQPQEFLGHNPLGRLALTAIYLVLITMALSGLVRTGTDIYYPPFGVLVTHYVAAEGADPDTLIPYDKNGVNADRLQRLDSLKSPFGTVHTYGAWLLMALIVLHITAVVFAEVRETGGWVSAMFSGRKMVSGKPADGSAADDQAPA
jgi:cytochrome b